MVIVIVIVIVITPTIIIIIITIILDAKLARVQAVRPPRKVGGYRVAINNSY